MKIVVTTAPCRAYVSKVIDPFGANAPRTVWCAH